jgi:eukaryotic-like serine/threonine-protein kinase
MSLHEYELLAPTGSGPDGLRYAGTRTADGKAVEVHLLAAARAEPDRWNVLTRRLHLCDMLQAHGAVRILERGLNHDPPYVVLDKPNLPTLPQALIDRLPLPPAEALALSLALADALRQAHTLGLTHSRLRPETVQYREDGQVSIDFTGLRTDGPLETPDSTDPAEDIRGMGQVLSWLWKGQPSSWTETMSSLVPFLESLHHPDPGERPHAAEVLDRLRQMQDSLRSTAQSLIAPVGSLPLQGRVSGSSPPLQGRAPSCSPPLQGGAEGVIQSTDLGATGEFTGDSLEAVLPGQTGDYLSTSLIVSGVKSLAPSARETIPMAGEKSPLETILERGQLGRFRLMEKLGEGGMGAVFRAEDLADGKTVAIKVLGDRATRKPDAVRRFHKEARLLGEVNNPHVTNLLEINEDAGVLYLVMEFVAGQSLSKLLAEQAPLPEEQAVTFAADLCRALADAHERGIVHRDVKPENVLLMPNDECRTQNEKQTPTEAQNLRHSSFYILKLTDFGLARHVVESESLAVTRDGAVLGTPLYMSPEQCKGEPCDPRSDVYALGVTLFEMLTGKPPFTAETPITVLTMHCTEPPPSLKKLRPELSDGICQIVEKALAKYPGSRFLDARTMLRELERLQRGEPASIAVHPRLPERDASKTVSNEYVWELEASPQQLWPHVSNTERWNRAIGLSAVEFRNVYDPEEDKTERFAEAKVVGLKMAWQEHPFEWIEARRYGVLREFSQGPLKWFVSVVDLEPRLGGGTRLVHRIYVEPRNLLARTAFAVQMAMTRRGMDRAYRRIDAAITGKLGDPNLVDPFEEQAKATGTQRRRVEQKMDRLVACGIDPRVAEQLGEFLLHAPPQEVARIRPLALAQRLGLNPEQVVAACLHGVREGLLVLFWDLLCPLCRIPSQIVDTLKALKEHGQCEACHLDYELDFAQSVEMIFRVHPEIRASDLGIFCIGGPAHSPHVVAQVRVAAGEQCDLELSLAEGAYRLRGPQLPYARDFQVRDIATQSTWEVRLGRTPGAPVLKSGKQVLTLINDTTRELVVRVERTTSRTDALTAARASSLALFRELFPNEVLTPGQLISMTNMTFLVTRLTGLEEDYTDETGMFALLHEHFRQAEERIRKGGGALVKTIDEGFLAAFSDTVAAVRAALDLYQAVADQRTKSGKPLRFQAGLHRGPALVTTLNGQLDYFGQCVKTAWKLLAVSEKGELILTERVAADAEAQSVLRAKGGRSRIVSLDAGPGRTEVLHCWARDE